MNRNTILSSLFIRIGIAVFTRTVFQPDEYFQSLEPAFHLVFGYGHLTWEWLSEAPIRSIVYPALNVPLYWFLKTTGLAYAGALGDALLITLPRILHGCLAALTDVWLCELARVTLGNDYVSTAYFLSVSSFFHVLALSRSLSNSLETSLSAVAFAHYPWDASSKLSPQVLYNRQHLRKALIFSALACMVRPTNTVVWIFLYSRLAWSLHRYPRILGKIISEAFVVALAALGSIFALDSLYYGRPIFTPYNFLKTNLSSVSLFYGSNPWHYYLTQAIPILCSTALPFTLHGGFTTIFRQRKGSGAALKNILGVIMWSITIYSFAGHKEWRFIHPLLPLLHVFAAKSLVDLSPATKAKVAKTKPNKVQDSRITGLLPPLRRSHLTFLLLTFPASIYIVLFYCSAPIGVLSYLRALPVNATTIDGRQQPQSVGFLMPCHSTPGQAYLHRPTWEVWFLGCEPPLQGQSLSTYRDQSDIFFDSPLAYITSTFPESVDTAFPRSSYPASIPGASPPNLNYSGEELYPWRYTWPRHLVFFGALLQRPGVKELLEEKGYTEVGRRGRNWEGEGERKGGVRVWSWRD